VRLFRRKEKRESGGQLGAVETEKLLLVAREIAAFAKRGERASVPPQIEIFVGPRADVNLQAIVARALVTMAKDEPVAADAAVYLLDLLLARAPAAHPDRGQWLVALFLAILDRHERDANRADLQRAAETAMEIVAASPHSADILILLGDAYWRHYDGLGDVDDLERAVEHYERAFATETADLVQAPRNWTELASLHLAHHIQFGREENAHRAVECATRALALTPERDPDWGSCAVLLATTHNNRYTHYGAGADLDRAIELGERAMSVLRRQDEAWPQCAGQLSLGHVWRYLRDSERSDSERSDLERGVEFGELAVAAGPGQVDLLANLALAYQTQYEKTTATADFERAVELHERALAAASGPIRGTILANLGLLHRRRYRRSGDIADLERADLDRAIDAGNRALAELPDGHPATASAVGNVAVPHTWRFRYFGQAVDEKTLTTLAGRALGATSSPVDDRVMASHAVGTLALATDAHDVAVELLDNAVALLPSVSPRHGGQSDHEHRFGEQMGVVSGAVDAHCAVGDLEGAVRVAEQGRGVFLGQQLSFRSGLKDLGEADSGLAEQLRQVREALAIADGSIAGTERRRRLWAEHDDLVARIRRIPGFEQFLAAPPVRPHEAVSGGYVLLVNAGHKRGDAIIISPGHDLVHVPLPELTWLKSTSLATQMVQLMHDTPTLTTTLRKQREIPELLTWLWEAVAGPVLDALPDVTGGTPKVWWLPTGVLGMLPLHAAGRPGEPGALDAVVSSYTANLRTLAHVRARPAAAARRQLLVAMTRTPGLPDLPGSAREMADVVARRPEAVSFVDRDATSARLLAALPDANWAHFACHATADLAVPSRGGLWLHDGILPLPAIGALQLADAELAYLSACSTAVGGALNIDESLHLASAFQLAGFRHVVASLWPLDDSAAAQAAQSFYERLPDTADAGQAATVLRDVSLDLRAQRPSRPDLWAPLIHYGR
jgi:tetratricopeptide (TPR) repeat protein